MKSLLSPASYAGIFFFLGTKPKKQRKEIEKEKQRNKELMSHIKNASSIVLEERQKLRKWRVVTNKINNRRV